MTNNWDNLRSWVSAVLGEHYVLPDEPFSLDDARSHGMLPWLAYHLHDSNTRDSLPDEHRQAMQQSLRRWSLMHLDCEVELERLTASADQVGLRFLTFKGHAVARTLYPQPACRPTTDFDLLISPGQVALAQNWLRAAGYQPLQAFVGTVWLGAQSWARLIDGKARFHVDLHWDYTNRMYFRKRLGFEQLWAESETVACGDGEIRVPSKVDNLVLACVHLTALKPGALVRLIWMLDVYLLMASLDEAEVQHLLQRAEQAYIADDCWMYGELASGFGDVYPLRPVLNALRSISDNQRCEVHYRTMRWRWYDLGAYWLRLPVKKKFVFFADVFRWVRVR